LVGPVELLRAADVDLETFTFTLPLYRGEMTDGTPVWYILTDTTDEGNANALGLNHSPKLAYANVEGAVRTATLAQDLTLIFDQGAVDFAPERRISPGFGDEPFPPVVAEPGSVGDAAYSPLVRIENAGGHIYNAPIIAQGVEAEELQGFCEGAPDYGRVHDRVISICPDRALVTLKAVAGFSFARPVVYVSFEASDPMAATMEQSTFAPALANIQVGFDDGAFSAVERLFSFANGPTGVGNPQRQGFASVLSGESTEPLNVFGGVPTIALDYSPLWDLNLGIWTDEAIDAGYRSRMIDEFQSRVCPERRLARPGSSSIVRSLRACSRRRVGRRRPSRHNLRDMNKDGVHHPLQFGWWTPFRSTPVYRLRIRCGEISRLRSK